MTIPVNRKLSLSSWKESFFQFEDVSRGFAPATGAPPDYDGAVLPNFMKCSDSS
jgi:hypothetical protein